MSYPTSQPTSFPISDALANGIKLTLSQLPTEEGERVASQVANYLKTNYNIEFPCNGAGTPLAKRRAVHVTGPSPMLRLMAKKDNYELIVQLNGMVDSICEILTFISGSLDQTSYAGVMAARCEILTKLGNNISLIENNKSSYDRTMFTWDAKKCKTWHSALSIVCEGCVEPIFDEDLDAEAQSEKRDRLHTLLDQLDKIRPDKQLRTQFLRYTVENNYYDKHSSQASLSSLILGDFINHDDFNIFYSTLNLLFECCDFKPKTPLNPLSDEVLEAIKKGSNS